LINTPSLAAQLNNSKSPRIHKLFAEQTQQTLIYASQEVNAEQFTNAVSCFFLQAAKA